MNKTSRRSFIKRYAPIAALPFAGSTAAWSATPQKQPNFVFLFADDLGWGDLSCYGNRRLKTPKLDRLAKQGTLLTQFYVSGSVCSPSRTAIMTGHYPARHRVHGHFATRQTNERRNMPNWLDPEVTTVTDLLRKNGYATGHFGKWHLGGNGTNYPSPEEYGVDSFHTDAHGTPRIDIWSPEQRPVVTKNILDTTIKFIEANKNKPFYANAWFSDPHATLCPSEEQMKAFQRFAPKGVSFKGMEQVYFATVAEMDKQIGIFMEKLDKLGLRENTYVIFSSDNGPEDYQIINSAHSGAGSNGPFRGRKRSIYEGGIRVPFIVRGPKVPAGHVDNDSIVAGVDYLPTICALAGIQANTTSFPLDGENMAQVFSGETKQRTRPLMWEWRYQVFGHTLNRCPMLAIREGKWKLLMNPDRSRIELYDIPNDPSEMQNLAKAFPNVTRKLEKQVLAWSNTLPESPRDSNAGENFWPWPKSE